MCCFKLLYLWLYCADNQCNDDASTVCVAESITAQQIKCYFMEGKLDLEVSMHLFERVLKKSVI